MVSSLFLLRRYHRPQRHDPRRTTSGGKPIYTEICNPRIQLWQFRRQSKARIIDLNCPSW